MINFDAQTHTYTNEKGETLISVTQLLKLAGISPNYDFVNEELLKASADRGTLIHKEIEDYIKKGEMGFTTELKEFINYVESVGIKVLASEKQVYNNKIAGTIDLIAQYPSGKVVYVDFKTTSTIHKQAVSWQLSIYKNLDQPSDHEVDANYEDADLEVWHFCKDGSLEVRNVLEVTGEQLAELYKCVITGQKYELQANDLDLETLYDAEKLIAFYERQRDKAEQAAKKVREQIVETMKKQGITKFENDNLIITYIAPTTKDSFDSTRFKTEHPKEYQKYVKTSKVKEQIRIKIKENNNE